MSAPAVATAEPRVATRPDLDHVVCLCDEDTALCGEDVSVDPWTYARESERSCVVCDDLEALPCERCGA